MSNPMALTALMAPGVGTKGAESCSSALTPPRPLSKSFRCSSRTCPPPPRTTTTTRHATSTSQNFTGTGAAKQPTQTLANRAKHATSHTPPAMKRPRHTGDDTKHPTAHLTAPHHFALHRTPPLRKTKRNTLDSQHYTIQFCTTLQNTAQRNTAQHFITLHCATPRHTALKEHHATYATNRKPRHNTQPHTRTPCTYASSRTSHHSAHSPATGGHRTCLPVAPRPSSRPG
jgi:hypothetical protein